MKLAILHYHLNRGGVTRVIANQLLALDCVLSDNQRWPVALFHGGRRAGWEEDLPRRLVHLDLSLHEIPALDYDDEQHVDNDRWPGPWPLLEQLLAALNGLDFTPADTVFHVHNHALGKNLALPQVAMMLAADYPFLLQIHDFAEDFRPANYRRLMELADRDPAEHARGSLFCPQAPQIHYAVLNSRDREILLAAGTDPGQLHLLPNPVPAADELPERDSCRRKLAARFDVDPDSRYVLYPVRCIRRKNVGEVLLLAALAPPRTVFGLTLEPLNPAEQPVYRQWKDLAAELDLPCRFETGGPEGLTFAENLAAADMNLTTSVAEGFGMVYLESWLAGLPLVGRDLPEITTDFTAAGIELPWLRSRLEVPLEWIGQEEYRRRMTDAYRQTLAAYRRTAPDDSALEQYWDARCEQGTVDFADLDEALQADVIRRVCADGADRERLRQCNPWIGQVLSIEPGETDDVIARNERTVREHFSLQPSGRRLEQLYATVSAASGSCRPPSGLPAAERILDRFLDPDRFRLLRSQGVSPG